MQPDEPTDEERLEELPQDNQTPFSAPPAEPDDSVEDDELVVAKQLDDTHPITDTDLQSEGVYQDGLADEANATEPNAGNQVVGYDPAAQDDQVEGVS